MSSEEEADQSMASVLRGIGLQEFIDIFEENKISLEQVDIMTDEDFGKLGVYVMGSRLKIKQACKNALKDKTIPVSFEELLTFISGADTVPPCGFPRRITVQFYAQEEGVVRMPHVSTCALELYLPRGMDDTDVFQSLMIRALKESLGFEKI